MARKMADLTWLRVGGPAEFFYQPSDLDDLCNAMRAIPKDVPIFPMGVGSNLIVRDGGESQCFQRVIGCCGVTALGHDQGSDPAGFG